MEGPFTLNDYGLDRRLEWVSGETNRDIDAMERRGLLGI